MSTSVIGCSTYYFLLLLLVVFCGVEERASVVEVRIFIFLDPIILNSSPPPASGNFGGNVCMKIETRNPCWVLSQ